MSISSAINSAQSGLNATSRRADIVANNVANASTPGYVRRSVTLSENILNSNVSGGVVVEGITRNQNALLQTELRATTSDLARADVLSSIWSNLSTRVGDTADGPGLFNSMAEFESALSAAVLSPESGTEAQALLMSAENLVDQFNSLSAAAQQVRAEADAEIATTVNTINSALQQIEALNGKIAGTDISSNYGASLLDERGRVLDALSEFLPVQAVPRDSGTIDVITPEGVFLIGGSRAATIEFTPSSAFQANQTIEGGQLSGMMVNGIDITPGANSFGAVSSGTLAALFQTRDQDIPAFSEQLDTVANDLVTRLSADGIDPTTASGDFGLFVDLDPAAGAGLAGRLQINSAVDPAQGGEIWRLRDGMGALTEGEPGNKTILTAMLDALTAVNSINTGGLQGNFSATGMAAELSSLVGQNRVSHEAVFDSTNIQYTALYEAQQSESGVDIDAQMQELLLVEQAYAANARVIEVASQMINRLMEL